MPGKELGFSKQLPLEGPTNCSFQIPQGKWPPCMAAVGSRGSLHWPPGDTGLGTHLPMPPPHPHTGLQSCAPCVVSAPQPLRCGVLGANILRELFLPTSFWDYWGGAVPGSHTNISNPWEPATCPKEPGSPETSVTREREGFVRFS